MPVICEKPLIEILGLDEQHDRLDTVYYLPEFIEAENFLETSPHEMTMLGEIMTDDASYGVLPPSSSYCDEGIALVRSSNISNEGVDYDSAVQVPSEWIRSVRARIKKNDILISIKGARAFYDMCVVQGAPPEAIVNGSIFRFQCSDSYLPKFVVLWLLSKEIQTLVYRERTNLGISYISSDILESIPIPKIGIDFQKTIIDRYIEMIPFVQPSESKLSAFRKKKIDLDRQYDVVFNEIGVVSPPPSSKVRVIKSHEIDDRMDWKYYDPSYINSNEELSAPYAESVSVRDITTYNDNYGSGNDPEEDCRLIKVKLHGKGAVLREIKKRKKISGPLAPANEGEIVFSRIRCAQKGIAIVPSELKGSYVSKEYYLTAINNELFNKELLWRILCSKRYISYYKSLMTGGTTRYRMNIDDYFNMRVPKHSISTQESILEKLKQIERKQLELNGEETTYLSQCETNRKGLLSKLSILIDDLEFQDLKTELKETLQ